MCRPYSRSVSAASARLPPLFLPLPPRTASTAGDVRVGVRVRVLYSKESPSPRSLPNPVPPGVNAHVWHVLVCVCVWEVTAAGVVVAKCRSSKTGRGGGGGRGKVAEGGGKRNGRGCQEGAGVCHPAAPLHPPPTPSTLSLSMLSVYLPACRRQWVSRRVCLHVYCVWDRLPLPTSSPSPSLEGPALWVGMRDRCHRPPPPLSLSPTHSRWPAPLSFFLVGAVGTVDVRYAPRAVATFASRCHAPPSSPPPSVISCFPSRRLFLSRFTGSWLAAPTAR